MRVKIIFLSSFRKCTWLYLSTFAGQSDWEMLYLFSTSTTSNIFFNIPFLLVLFSFVFHLFVKKKKFVWYCFLEGGLILESLILVNGKTVKSLILTEIFFHNHFYSNLVYGQFARDIDVNVTITVRSIYMLMVSTCNLQTTYV